MVTGPINCNNHTTIIIAGFGGLSHVCPSRLSRSYATIVPLSIIPFHTGLLHSNELQVAPCASMEPRNPSRSSVSALGRTPSHIANIEAQFVVWSEMSPSKLPSQSELCYQIETWLPVTAMPKAAFNTDALYWSRPNEYSNRIFLIGCTCIKRATRSLKPLDKDSSDMMFGQPSSYPPGLSRTTAPDPNVLWGPQGYSFESFWNLNSTRSKTQTSFNLQRSG